MKKMYHNTDNLIVMEKIIKGVFPKIKSGKFILLLIPAQNKIIEKEIGDYQKALNLSMVLEKVYKDYLILNKSETIHYPNPTAPDIEISRDNKTKKIILKINTDENKTFKTVLSIQEFLNVKRRLEHIITEYEFSIIETYLTDEDNKNEEKEEKVKKTEQPTHTVESEVEENKNDFESIKQNLEIMVEHNLEVVLPSRMFDNPKIFCTKYLPKDYSKLKPYTPELFGEVILAEHILSNMVWDSGEFSFYPNNGPSSELYSYIVHKLLITPALNLEYYIDPDIIDQNYLKNSVQYIIKNKDFTLLPNLISDNFEKIELLANTYFNNILKQTILQSYRNSELYEDVEKVVNTLRKNVPNNLEELSSKLIEYGTDIAKNKMPLSVESILLMMVAI
jgi:hypothetical protein